MNIKNFKEKAKVFFTSALPHFFKTSVPNYFKNSFIYPYSKAIAQALVVPVPKVDVEEISYEDLKLIESERGMGALGSSNK